jgi:hypothetical protein
MKYRNIGEAGSFFCYTASEGGSGAMVDLRCAPDIWSGVVAGGTIHHLAWRTPTDDAQRAWHDEIAGVGLNVTPQLDRHYFQSMSATITPRDRRLYQLDFSVNEWSERHDILLPEGLPTADARDEDAHAQRTEALAAIVASLRHASDP